MRTFAVLLVVLAPGTAGCVGDSRGPPPAVLAERAEAARNACVADELLRRSDDKRQTLESSYAQAEAAGEAGAVVRQASLSALQFAEVYHQHAELHRAVLAHVDTAMNHAERQADSVRHVRAAEAFTMSRPARGSIEANALDNYLRDFRAIRSNDDHPCNWAVQ